MKITKIYPPAWIILFIFSILYANLVLTQSTHKNNEIDVSVKTFLKNRQGTWRDLNVPASDGKILYDLIVKNNYKAALEIGTSTGHSAIWMAWALSKTGGRLTTIEIDPDRYREAVANFNQAGLADFIDARLADAHQLVKELTGPFDFVFCDADKDWYKNYFVELYPKLKVSGCYTAHNVSDRGRGWHRGGTGEFYDYIKSLANMETTVNHSGAGLSISYKKSEK